MSAQQFEPRTRGFGHVEAGIIEHCKKHGSVRPAEMHRDHGGPYRDPATSITRLCKQGFLVRRERGLYVLSESSTERLDRIRANAPTVRARDLAPNALHLGEHRKILKGAYLAFDTSGRSPSVGDVVLLEGPEGFARLGRFEGWDNWARTTTPKGVVLSVVNKTGAVREIESLTRTAGVALRVRIVVGAFRKCTKSAAAARAMSQEDPT